MNSLAIHSNWLKSEEPTITVPDAPQIVRLPGAPSNLGRGLRDMREASLQCHLDYANKRIKILEGQLANSRERRRGSSDQYLAHESLGTARVAPPVTVRIVHRAPPVMWLIVPAAILLAFVAGAFFASQIR